MARHAASDTTDTGIELVPSEDPPTHAVIERWYEDTFINVGLDDQLSNRVRAAVTRLKDLIAATR